MEVMNKPKARHMNTQTIPSPSTQQSQAEQLRAAMDEFAEKVKGRLHAYVKETHNGRPAISCIWNESPKRTHKDVVYVGPDGFDALTVARAGNKGMNASAQVVSMLVELYVAHNKQPVGEEVEY